MLTHLHIENVAVIEKIDVSFHTGFNVLTGETGAGKSILIDAINLVLGARSSKDMIRSGEQKALVEAQFDSIGKEAIAYLAENGIEAPQEEPVILLREIGVDSKGICRINGRMVSISHLRELGGYLVNIHGQNDSHQFSNQRLHGELLDQFVLTETQKEEFAAAYQIHKQLRSELKDLKMDDLQKSQRMDFLKFQINELIQANLKQDEDVLLLEQRKRFLNSEKLTESILAAFDLLYEGEKQSSAYDLINRALEQLEKLSAMEMKLNGAAEKLSNIKFILDDVIEEVGNAKSRLENDDINIDEVESRLDFIYRLKGKYGASVAEMLEYLKKAQAELLKIENLETTWKEKENEYERQYKILCEMAETLSEKRKVGAKILSEKILAQLSGLEMGKIRFEVLVSKAPELTKSGFDHVEFMISANAGEPMKPLSKIASGGELSRIMLALKSVLADGDKVNTMIFDEIDSGVSGRAAQKIAEKINAVAVGKQVICITHLPQIASMADWHYLIKKSEEKEKTLTKVELLTDEGREAEVARITGGVSVTGLTLENAREMLQMARQIKKESA